MNDLFRKAAMRVAGRVYVNAMESGNRDAAIYAWFQLVRLIALRSAEEVMALEKRMGVRR